jgi:predicted MPP superfamily phosphohydrolase
VGTLLTASAVHSVDSGVGAAGPLAAVCCANEVHLLAL